MTNWQKEIDEAREMVNDTSKIVAVAPENVDLSREFNAGYGGTNGEPFTLWTELWVYFPVQYDGAEWVNCVPRNPCDVVTEHVGGG